MSSRRQITPDKLSAIWSLYLDFRRGQVQPSTFQRDYRKFSRRIARLRAEGGDLATSLEIRDWLMGQYAPETVRRTIQQFNACCRWAMESELIAANPFEGLQKQIKVKRPSEKAWASFTAQERDRIIQSFDLDKPFYSPWVKFLFWTGTRPEESAALTWGNVSPDCTEILIHEAFPVDMHERQGTKNGKTTRFPCNTRLQRLLREQRPGDWSREQFVFPGREGSRFDYHNFQTRHWRPLVLDLVESGHVAFYLSQYHCRHTWITLALEHLPVADVSYLARVSTGVLYAHYAGRSRNITIPEF